MKNNNTIEEKIMKINTLTTTQQELIKVYLSKWIKNGHSITPLNHEKTIETIKLIYRLANFPEPTNFLFFQSPLKCQIEANNQLKNSKFKYQPMFYGNIGWVSVWSGFYDYILNVIFPNKKLQYKDFENLCEGLQNLHCFIPFDTTVFISEKPTQLHVNSQNQLHKDLGPALQYSDGYELYYLNGVAVTKELVMTRPEDLDINIFLKETNIQIRREIVRKIKPEILLKKLKGVLISVKDFSNHPVLINFKTKGNLKLSGRKYELYAINTPEGEFKILKMQNPSIETIHFEFVDARCNTVDQALGMRNNHTGWEKLDFIYTPPIQLT